VVAVQGDGSLEFRLRGAGVYLVQVSATYPRSVNGAGILPIHDTASFTVNAH
jgi:hypothetical protein